MKHLTPKEAWAYLQSRPEALLVDVRMEIEYLYVGHPPGAVHVPWYEYPDMHPDPARFVEQVRREAGGDLDRPLVLLCRSGKRTVAAGEALEAAGFREVINVLHGFEGDLDAHFHRNTVNGWRHDGLPWEQL
ncbi:rhodanese-like domain-containing protein [Caldimonas aquatica]|uniref:Rhodanese-like domain-containing protein n=1 Tax=Caldimonas aquatica TaxID=376175 RepID=A0ABY6MRY2_9BURK|nr:rhodanese-like domain-containing protein [Schlegelella aquatica]UZD54770.1 rhodanese-like domain-containing protein [Schlegelella aquatica]